MNIHRVMAGVVAALVIAPPTHAAAPAPADSPLACSAEDSVGCVWDGLHMGNGEGRSYIRTPNGRVVYVKHAFAHRLLSPRKNVECQAAEDYGCVIDGKAFDSDRHYIVKPNGDRRRVGHRFAHALIHKGWD